MKSQVNFTDNSFCKFVSCKSRYKEHLGGKTSWKTNQLNSKQVELSSSSSTNKSRNYKPHLGSPFNHGWDRICIWYFPHTNRMSSQNNHWDYSSIFIYFTKRSKTFDILWFHFTNTNRSCGKGNICNSEGKNRQKGFQNSSKPKNQIRQIRGLVIKL